MPLSRRGLPKGAVLSAGFPQLSWSRSALHVARVRLYPESAHSPDSRWLLQRRAALQIVLASALPFMGTCGGQGGSTVPRPESGITAVRGQPIADAVLVPWLEYHHVPGMSVAVASGDAIDWAQGYGVADAVSRRPVTPDTLFQAASISKPITAVTALSLFEEQGLDPDADVRLYLDSWRLPENAFTQGTPVTLRLLLSHSAGFNVHGFPGYAPGARLPSLVQTLDGAPPASNEPIRVTLEPGTLYRYSGGGYEVVQQLLADLAPGSSYAALVQARVFDPVGMIQSSLLDPLDTDAAATAHDDEGRVLTGRWRVYPELAAAAVWTTPSDLLRFAMELQRSYRGASERLLPPALTRQMLTRLRPTDVAGQFIGMGLFPEGPADDGLLDNILDNAGYRCYLVADLERPFAIAIMTNSEVGDRLFLPVIDAVRDAYSR
jgi:CubicO group peptidase (beta-lactamase class C family)